MRSQTFGFCIETRQIFEGIFPHPFHEVRNLLRHHIHIFGDFSIIQQRNITYGIPDLDSGFSSEEILLSTWDEEIHRTISLVHQACGNIDSIQRLEKMRQAFFYNWLKLQQSATIVHIALGALAGQETHMILTIGWGDDAPQYDVNSADNFFPLLIHRLGETKITYNSIRSWTGFKWETDSVSKRRKYGIRLDTVEKLNQLKKLRDEDKNTNGEVKLTKTEACEQVGLTVVTLRKYDRMLYERWYEMNF